jgi:hypothetical protein
MLWYIPCFYKFVFLIKWTVNLKYGMFPKTLLLLIPKQIIQKACQIMARLHFAFFFLVRFFLSFFAPAVLFGISLLRLGFVRVSADSIPPHKFWDCWSLWELCEDRNWIQNSQFYLKGKSHHDYTARVANFPFLDWANWTILPLYFGREMLVAEAIAKAKQDSFPNNEHT